MANEYSINFLLKAKDLASAPIKKLVASFESLRAGVKKSYLQMNPPSATGRWGALKNQFAGMQNSVVGLKDSAGMLSKVGGIGGMFGMMGGIAGGGMALKAMINNAMDFNTAMAKIASRIPGDREKLMSLKTGIQELSMDTGKSTDELSVAMLDLVNDFQKASAPELMERMRTSMKLSKLAFTDVATATDYLGRVTQDFGKTAPADMEKVGAMTFQAMKKADVGLEEFASTMSGIAPNAKNLGISMEEMYSVFSTFADGKEQFGQVANSMNFLTRSLLKAGPAMKEPGEELKGLDLAIQQIGYSSGKDLIGKEGFVGAMEKIIQYSKASGEPLEKLIGAGRGTQFALRLASKGTKELRDNMKQLPGAVDEANKALGAYDELNKSGKAWNQFKETATVASQELGEVVLPTFTSYIGGITSSIRSLRNIIKGNGGLEEAGGILKNVLSIAGGPLADILITKGSEKTKSLYDEAVQGYRGNAGKEGGYLLDKGTGRYYTPEEALSMKGKLNNAIQSTSPQTSEMAAIIAEANKKSMAEQVLRIVLPTDDEGKPILMVNKDSGPGKALTKQSPTAYNKS